LSVRGPLPGLKFFDELMMFRLRRMNPSLPFVLDSLFFLLQLLAHFVCCNDLLSHFLLLIYNLIFPILSEPLLFCGVVHLNFVFFFFPVLAQNSSRSFTVATIGMH
jgi:hypothetical protein